MSALGIEKLEDPMVCMRGIEKSFHGHPVLRGVDLDVQRGTVCCLLGRSGAGKSTLLRCVNVLEDVDSGMVVVDGELIGHRLEKGFMRRLPEREVAAQRAEIGIVFQRFNLFGHMTVLENIVEAPVRVRRESRGEVESHARELLEKVGLAGRENAYPSKLSGGQQQRVAIARALAMRPKVMLFDEPTSALDPELVDEVLSVMRDLAESGMTMIVVTHEVGFARDVADHVAFMDDGRIVEHGRPSDVIGSPQHESTRFFMSKLRS